MERKDRYVEIEKEGLESRTPPAICEYLISFFPMQTCGLRKVELQQSGMCPVIPIIYISTVAGGNKRANHTIYKIRLHLGGRIKAQKGSHLYTTYGGQAYDRWI